MDLLGQMEIPLPWRTKLFIDTIDPGFLPL
jgi:hypothetical protein